MGSRRPTSDAAAMLRRGIAQEAASAWWVTHHMARARRAVEARIHAHAYEHFIGLLRRWERRLPNREVTYV